MKNTLTSIFKEYGLLIVVPFLLMYFPFVVVYGIKSLYWSAEVKNSSMGVYLVSLFILSTLKYLHPKM